MTERRPQRIIVFQFHKAPAVCRERLWLLRRFNPALRIFGIFGGGDEDYEWACQLCDDGLESLYRFHGRDATWKWKNTDLVVRAWYRDFGHTLQFDVVHVVQWDLLLLDSLHHLYRRIPPGVLGLTGLTPLDAIADRWQWTTSEPYRTEWMQLFQFVRTELDYRAVPHACLGPGYCLPQAFLAEYAQMDVPELCHDELRLPLFAQILGFPMRDTGFYRRWFDPDVERTFNADDIAIDVETLKRELARADGQRSFHPCREVLWETLRNSVEPGVLGGDDGH